MKKALTRPGFNRVFQVVAAGEEFPVAAPLEWVDCGDDVTPDTHTFNGNTFAAIPDRPVPAASKREAAIEALLAREAEKVDAPAEVKDYADAKR